MDIMTAPKLSLAFLLVSLFVFVHSSPSEVEDTLTKSINQFSQRFFKETVAMNPGKNLIMSPLSVELVLTLLSMGARGNTLDELNSALYLPNLEFTKTSFKRVVLRLNNIKEVTLKIANKVYVGENFIIDPKFQKDAVDIFSSELQSLDFTQSDASASTINQWVESKTNNKIQNLISPDSLKNDTKMVLVNAIYFKGDWQRTFKMESSWKQDFYLNSKDKVLVDMMHQTSYFNYAHLSDWKAQVLEMKYVDNDVSMVIILPDEIEGLKDVEAKLLTADLKKDVFDQMHKETVELALPKFKIETEINLNDILVKLGMKSLFNGDSDFSGLSQSKEKLYVSKAAQKAFIEVNEKGTEAAAATYISFAPGSSFVRKTKTMTVDHQFLFIMKHGNNVAFLGHVEKF